MGENMMKKIFSLLTAGFLALGLMGCSGLHDLVENPYVPGGSGGDDSGQSGGSAWIAGEPTGGEFKEMTIEGEVFTFSFTYDANGAWGGKEGETRFTIISAADWDVYKEPNGYRWQSKLDTAATPEQAGELTEYEYDNHCVISGLTKGRTYKISASLTTTGGILSVAEIAVPDYQYLFGYYVVGDFTKAYDEKGEEKGWKVSPEYALAMPFSKSIENGDVVYKVEFTAPAGSIEFGIATIDWSSKYVGATIEVTSDKDVSDTVKLQTSGENNKVSGLSAGSSYYIVVTSKVDGTVTLAVETGRFVMIAGCRAIHLDYEDRDVGETVYFLEDWIPGNDWGANNPHGEIDASYTAEVKFSSPVKISTNEIKLQMVSYNGTGEFWDDKVGKGTKTAKNPNDLTTGYLVYDCEEDELSFVSEN